MEMGSEMTSQEAYFINKWDSQIIEAKNLWNLNKSNHNPYIRHAILDEINGLRNNLIPEGLSQGILNALKIFNPYKIFKEATKDTLEFIDQGFLNLKNIEESKINDINHYFKDIVSHARKSNHPYYQDLVDNNIIKMFKTTDVFLAPHLLEIALNPNIINIFIEQYNFLPTIVGFQVWDTNPSDDLDVTHHFHRDTDCFGFFKLFVYLSDTPRENGEHFFIKRSHNLENNIKLAKNNNVDFNKLYEGNCRHLGKDFLDKFYNEDVISFTGPAGSAFIENTYGFHRGSNLKKGKRRIFSVTYAITPMRIAVDLPSLFDASMDEIFLTDLEKYILRLYLK